MILHRGRRALPAMLVLTLASCGGGGGSGGGNSGSLGRQMGGSIEDVPLHLAGQVTTLAGMATAPGHLDGTGTAAMFQSPIGLATDGVNLYVVDSTDNTVREIVIATGVVTTLAGSAGVAGHADGTGAAATFNHPYGITTDGTNLYVADSGNHTLRKIVISTAAVTTIAGQATVPGSADGTGTAATFNYPHGITTDGANLYVADRFNHTIRRLVLSSGAVSTIAGQAGVAGHADGTGAAATFNYPDGITTDGTNLYVADTSNDTVRKIVIANGVVTTLAGTATVAGHADGTGTAATFYGPEGVTTDGTDLYVSDASNQTIRQVVLATGSVTTLAGQATVAGHADGTGSAATFFRPYGLTTDAVNVYVADGNNSTVRQIH